ncbi:demethoxyubiquinone hydroxylase family protein [Chloroflexota bacterium]
MNKEILALKFACNMERFATRIYLTQCRAFSGSEIIDKLRMASVNEKLHVERLQKRLKELKSGPSRLGFLFRFAGIIMGFITVGLGKLFILNIDTWIEKKAIKDYGSFIKKLNFDTGTEKLLRNIIKDEEKHVKTLQNSIKILKGKSKGKS